MPRRNGRPHGEVRQAIEALFTASASPGLELTCVEIAGALQPSGLVHPSSPSDVALVRCTVRNMQRAGVLRICSTRHVAGSKRPVNAYRLAVDEQPQDPSRSLALALASWRLV